MKTLKKLMSLFLLLIHVYSNCIIIESKHNPINENNIGISTNVLDEYTDIETY